MTMIDRQNDIHATAKKIHDTYVFNNQKNTIVTLFKEDWDFLKKKDVLRDRGAVTFFENIPVQCGQRRKKLRSKRPPQMRIE